MGNPLKIILTAGQVHDLVGADALLPDMEAKILLADKAFDADERVIKPLEAAGKTAVIPPKSHRRNPRKFDKALYEARHLIENFFCWIKQFRAIARDCRKIWGARAMRAVSRLALTLGGARGLDFEVGEDRHRGRQAGPGLWCK